MSVPRWPVTEIEGIGSATGRLLNAAQVFYTSDLLRLTAEQVHGYVSAVASLAEVEEWRNQASFLELRGMTGQWAEALVKGGVETLEELLAKDRAQLDAVFRQAEADGLIAAGPDDAALVEIVKDAAVVFHSGQSMGTVLGPDGTPLAGAVVSVGRLGTETDERGRYRLIRIPAATSHYLKIERAGYETLFEPDVRVSYDCRAVQLQYRRLNPSTAPAPLPQLDEYDGDELPTLASYRPVSESFPQEEIRPGDVLKVHRLYAASPHAKLVSIFRAYRAGDLIVRHVKVDLVRFAEPPVVGDVYHHRNGALVKVDGSVRTLERYRTLQKVKRSVREHPEFHELDPAGQIGWLLDAYNEKSVFSRFKPAPGSGS